MKILLLVLLLFPFLANADGVTKAETFTLKNGMEVVVIPNTKMPVISHMVWYKIGAADEQLGKSGIAHFLEHLMFKATKNYKAGEFSQIIAKTGGNDNAFTNSDYTAYYQNIPKEALATAMELESDRMQNILFDEKEVLKERDVILEERRMRIDNSPRSLLAEQMRATLFLNHPYMRPIIGWYHEIANLTVEDAKAWYKNYYNPANAILVVSGDITANELKPLAEKYYGKIPAGSKAIRNNFITEPKHVAARKIEFKDSQVKKPEVSRYYLAPSIIYGKKEHAYALAVLSYILGASDTSMMYQDMVVKNKKAVSAGSYYDDLNMGPSKFILSATPADGVSLAQIEAAFDANINKVLEHGVDEADLIRAKKAIVAASIYAREDLKNLANMYGAAAALGLGAEYVENWDNNINKVSREEVQAAAKEVFNSKSSVTGYLLPEENSKAAAARHKVGKTK